MSQQLTISSLISALALIMLALFARAGDLAPLSADAPAIVQAQSTTDFSA